jgi:hypothetical protein
VAHNPKHESGSPTDLANMRRQGVRGLIAVCLGTACGHEFTFGVDDYAGDLKLSWFPPRMICEKCNGPVDVRANWTEASGTVDDWSGRRGHAGW